jgi:hypothetical protein
MNAFKFICGLIHPLGVIARFTLWGGGSGGGGSPAPQQSTVTNTNIPEYAKPYVETMLGAAQQQIFNYAPGTPQYEDVPIYETQSAGPRGGARQVQTGTEHRLIPGTDQMNPTSIKDYQPFSNDPSAYFAGFSPMQEQAFQGAANMQSNPQSFAQGVGGYMSPYAMNALRPQLNELARTSAIQGTQQQAQAAQAGAFGGGRDALMRSERERNLNQQQSDVIGKGLQDAFGAAQNQYNTGFQQNLGINQLQNQYGGQQQGMEQSKINQQVQNYATQQQYPMMQLANMSNLLRGLPMQATTTQGYQAAPSTVSQIAGLGTAGIAGLGLYNTMNKGATS